VLTTNGAALWSMLRIMNADRRLPALGRLFEA
jgi:maleate cis-trans isomerase